MEQAGYTEDEATSERITRLWELIRVNNYMECKLDCKYIGATYGPDKDELYASKRESD